MSTAVTYKRKRRHWWTAWAHIAVFISLCYLDRPTGSTIPTVEYFLGVSDVRKEELLVKDLMEDLVFQHQPVLLVLKKGSEGVGMLMGWQTSSTGT
jgi:hypothetical protein